MSKIITRGLLIGLLIVVFFIGYKLPLIKPFVPVQSPIPVVEPKPIPYGTQSYIKDGVLYTSVAAVPLACITKVTVYSDPVLYVVIEYKYTQYHWGMLSISMDEYRRLFGDPKCQNENE